MGAHLRRLVAALAAGAVAAATAAAVAGPAAGAAPPGSFAPAWITETAREQRVKAFARLGSTLFVGGEFLSVSPAPNAPPVARPYLVALDAETGVLLPGFAPVIVAPPGTELDPSGVLALAADPATNSLFVGGTFTSVNDQPVRGLAVLDATTGALKPGVAQRSVSRSNGKASVDALLRVGTKLYLGGAFDAVGGATRRNLARFDLSAGAPVLDGWSAATNAPVFSLAADSTFPDRIYVGGIFTGAGPGDDPKARFLCAFDTTAPNALVPWFPQPDGGDKPGTVLGLDAKAGRVYAAIAGGGGQFNVYDGNLAAKKILVKQMRANGNQQAVKVVGDVVYVGGHHDAYLDPAADRPKLAAFDVATLAPRDDLPAGRPSGVWGVFAIYGEDDPADVWFGGQLVSVTDATGSANTGNVWHQRPTPPDTSPPTAPGRPTVTQGVLSNLQVSWTPSTDGSVVSAYYVYANGTLKAVASGRDTSTSVSGLASGTTYQVTVRALDGARNLSAPSPATTATTGAGLPGLPSPLKGFGQLYPVTPFRALDTRTGLGLPAAGPVVGGVPVSLQVTGVGEVPVSGVAMVALNVTVVGPSAAGYLTVQPAGAPTPSTSNLNFAAGQTVPNLVLAKVSAAGQVDLRLSAGQAHVLADVVGWFGSSATTTPGSKLALQQPARLLDTRASSAVGPGGTVDVQVAPAGSNVSAVVVNLTGVTPTAGTYVTAYPADQAQPPNASNLNLVPGEIRPNLAVVRVPTTGPGAGRIRLYNASGTTHLLVDLLGTFTRRNTFDNDPSGRLLALDAPLRIVDSRAMGGPLAGPASAVWDVRAIDDATPAKVVGLVLNATATQATAPTYLTLYPAGNPVPTASNLNVLPGQDVPNAAIVGLSASDRLAVFNETGRVHHLLDVSAVVLGS